MGFPTADEANRFLVAQLIQEANRSGESLSSVDEHELLTPGCGHTADEDEALDAQLPPDYSHWELRTRAACLLHRAYHGAFTDDATRRQFSAAYAMLRNSPYILTNLSHVDAPFLRAVEWLRIRSALESATMALAAALPRSVAPLQAAARPGIVAVLSVLLLGALGIATALVLWR